MNIADPKYLEHLRDLPSSYLLDLLVENEDIDRASIIWVLKERGQTNDDIEREIIICQRQPWRRPYILWTVARWLAIFNASIVSYFNFSGLFGLINDDHLFKVPLLFFAVGSIVFGFFIGFKLTTHIYHGSKPFLYCGFPFPVGFVELKTGEEIQKDPSLMYILMAINALVAVSLTLFPLVFVYINMT